MSAPIEFARLKVNGDVASVAAVTFSGKPKTRHFCAKCGTRMWHRTADNQNVTLKVGTLDDASGISPRGHLWVSKKQPWIVLDPALPAFDTQPDDVQAWREGLNFEEMPK